MSKFAIEPYVRIQGSGAAAKDIWATKSWITDSGNSFARLISRITVAFCNALETIISRPACHGCAAYPRLFLRLLQHQTSAAATLLHKSCPRFVLGHYRSASYTATRDRIGSRLVGAFDPIPRGCYGIRQRCCSLPEG